MINDFIFIYSINLITCIGKGQIDKEGTFLEKKEKRGCDTFIKVYEIIFSCGKMFF